VTFGSVGSDTIVVLDGGKLNVGLIMISSSGVSCWISVLLCEDEVVISEEMDVWVSEGCVVSHGCQCSC
jgi:hypothetical protein